jgi:hypothetical protein
LTMLQNKNSMPSAGMAGNITHSQNVPYAQGTSYCVRATVTGNTVFTNSPRPINRMAYLDYLYYVLNRQQDYSLFILSEKYRTKRMPYLKVAGRPLTANLVNNRTLLISEVVIDIDPMKAESRKALDLRFLDICGLLMLHRHRFRAYHTGSKGYHIHVHLPRLAYLCPVQRQVFRERFILSYGAELEVKGSDKSPIALEHAPHWRTGNIKTMVISTMTED